MCKKIAYAVCFIFLSASCSRQTEKNGILIAVSIPPQAWFVSQIAGDKAACITLVPAGQNQHAYEPGPRQIQSLMSADAWILSGAEFEISLRPKIENLFPNVLVIDGTQDVKFRYIEAHEHDEANDHNNDNDQNPVFNSHSDLTANSSLELDRHTWLGREPAKILASHIKDTLCAIDNKNKEYYQAQYNSLAAAIDIEFDKLKISLAPLKGRSVFVYHPSFGYFLDEFGIVQEAVEKGGKEPSVRELNNLITKINEEQAAAIFVQTQFPASAAKTLASAANLELISLDPLSYNWLENIRQIGQALGRAVR
jgi:zinc transport system substrate-binding protein